MCYYGIAHVPTGRLKLWDPDNDFPPGISCATHTSSWTPMSIQYKVNEPCSSTFGPQACQNNTLSQHRLLALGLVLIHVTGVMGHMK